MICPQGRYLAESALGDAAPGTVPLPGVLLHRVLPFQARPALERREQVDVLLRFHSKIASISQIVCCLKGGVCSKAVSWLRLQIALLSAKSRPGLERPCPSYTKRQLNSNLSGNEVYYTACSLLVILNNSFRRFHCQKGFNLILVSNEILATISPGRAEGVARESVCERKRARECERESERECVREGV